MVPFETGGAVDRHGSRSYLLGAFLSSMKSMPREGRYNRKGGLKRSKAVADLRWLYLGHDGGECGCQTVSLVRASVGQSICEQPRPSVCQSTESVSLSVPKRYGRKSVSP